MDTFYFDYLSTNTFVRDFTIRSNTNGLGLQSNAIKDLYPLILHLLVVGWIGKAHSPTMLVCIIGIFMLTSHLWCTIYTLFILEFFFFGYE